MGLTTRRNFVAAALAGAAATQVSAAPRPRYRTLGKTGLKVTELGFGCESASDPMIYRRGLELGINFYDTARTYESGNAERVLGQTLGARRKDVVLCSRSYANTGAEFTKDLDTSLKTVGADYFDVYYIGAKDNPAQVSDDLLEAQVAAQKAGKMRFRGFSTHRNAAMEPVFRRGKFDVALLVYNFTQGKPGRPSTEGDQAMAQRSKEGLGVVAMKVMAGGARMTNRSVFEKHPGAPLSALKWAMRTPNVHTTIVRMSSLAQLEQNARVMTESFTQEDDANLQAALPQVTPYICRMCGACDGVCPRGVPASDLVRYAMYAEDYHDFAMGYERFQMLPAAVREVSCSDCAACPIRCPNGVRVRERLIRAQELFGEPYHAA